MYYIYILESQKNGKYYIGYSTDVNRRLEEHNRGKVKSTRNITPFVIAHTENYDTSREARNRESFLKRQKSHKYLRELISNSACSSVGLESPDSFGKVISLEVRN